MYSEAFPLWPNQAESVSAREEITIWETHLLSNMQWGAGEENLLLVLNLREQILLLHFL